jgi:hypothetical protein
MKKIIPIAFVFIVLSTTIFGQVNRISIGVGYPFNLTNHWLVENWESPISLDLKFTHEKSLLLIGGGINYSKYNVSWFRNYNSDNKPISNLSPYIQIGLIRENRILSIIPYLNLGYSTLITDIEIHNGKKGGIYSAIGLDGNFNLTNKIQLGLGANYAMIFNKLEFEFEGQIPHDFIPIEDRYMKSFTLNLNLSYKL